VKKILIIGGSYFFGRVFVETLLEKGGCEITVLNRGKIPFRNPAVKEIVCDRRDAGLMAGKLAASEWDAVIDFCAYTADDIQILMQALSRSQLSRYILISTASVYAEQGPAVPLTEEAPLLNSPLPGDEDYGGYVWNKLQAEQAAAGICTGRGTDWTILRPAVIFGKFNYAPRESWFFEKIIAGEKIVIPGTEGDGTSVPQYSFVSVWDAAVLTAWCLDSPETRGQCFNLAAPEKISYGTLIETFSEASGIDLNVERLSVQQTLNLPIPFPPDRSLLYSGARISELSGINYTDFNSAMKRTWELYLIGHGIDRRSIPRTRS